MQSARYKVATAISTACMIPLMHGCDTLHDGLSGVWIIHGVEVRVVWQCVLCTRYMSTVKNVRHIGSILVTSAEGRWCHWGEWVKC